MTADPFKANWNPASWRRPVAEQAPHYENSQDLQATEGRLSSYPPLVLEGEITLLKKRLAQVEAGESFLLQGGDCAESFADFGHEKIRDDFRVLLQMAVILTFGAKRPVVKIGRVAGQYAKPRSSAQERRGTTTLPSYRGDIINGHEFSEMSRRHDPARMERAYFQSAATLNLLRALAGGGFADLHRVHAWSLEFAERSAFKERYEAIAKRIDEAMRFMRAAGLKPEAAPELATVEFFTSHEALLLNYEEALTRQADGGTQAFAGSAHMLWIGDRTRRLDGAHVEYARGVMNPIGLKCGPDMRPEDLLRLIDVLNPGNEPGKLTLITRFGSDRIEEKLPKMIRRVQGEGRRVVWCCDPMHGNTYTAQNGRKTRAFDSVLRETKNFFQIHESEGSTAGGVHLELTGKNVTECVGGGEAISESSLETDTYESLCDPRLNANQALELAFQLVRL